MRKAKEIERDIPDYLKSSPADIMIWTYVHAAQSLYPSTSTHAAIVQFHKDFDFYHLYYSGAANFYNRFAARFNNSEKLYCNNPMYNIYLVHTLETMLFAWCTYYRKHLTAYSDELAARDFCEYFSLLWTPDEMEFFLKRIINAEYAELSHPSIPKRFVISK